jgi:hypothetical protein
MSQFKKIDVRSIIDKGYSALLILILFKWFYLVPDTGNLLLRGNTDGRYDMLMLVSILYILAYILINKRLYLGSYGRIAIPFVIFIVIQYVYTFLRYGQFLSEINPTKIYYFAILIYFALVITFRRKENFEWFIRFLAICTIFMCCLLLYQRVYYITTGNLFLYTDAVRANTLVYEIRSLGLRFNAGNGIVTFSTAIYTAYLFRKKSDRSIFELLYKVAAILGYLTVLLVFQSRVLIIIMSFILFLNILVRGFRQKIFRVLFIIFAVSFMVIMLSTNSAIINQVIGVSVDEGSYWAREGAVSYYIKIFLQNPLLGLGLVVSNTIELNNLVHGPSGYFYYSDVGMIGNLAELGIFVLLWFLALLYSFYKQSKKYSDYKKSVLINIILLMGLCTFSTLSVFNNDRYLIIPLSMSVGHAFFMYSKQHVHSKGPRL